MGNTWGRVEDQVQRHKEYLRVVQCDSSILCLYIFNNILYDYMFSIILQKGKKHPRDSRGLTGAGSQYNQMLFSGNIREYANAISHKASSYKGAKMWQQLWSQLFCSGCDVTGNWSVINSSFLWLGVLVLAPLMGLSVAGLGSQ